MHIPTDPLTAGHRHLLRTVALSDHPRAHRIASGRRVPDGAGVALAVLLTVVCVAGFGGIVWGLHVAGVLP